MENSEEKHWSYLPPREFGTMNSQEYIVERINQYRKWYDNKATSAKNTYLYMRSLTVLGSALVPVLINISNEIWIKYLSSGVSLMVIILISLETVYHYREQWKNYRSTEQSIAKEYFNFSTAEGPYKRMQKDDAFLLLVERVENAIESENASTLNVMTTVTENKSTDDNPNIKKKPE